MRDVQQVYLICRVKGGRVELAKSIDGGLRVFTDRIRAMDAIDHLDGTWRVAPAAIDFTLEEIMPRSNGARKAEV